MELREASRRAVDAPDRSPTDPALDAGRHPAETLAFYGISPSMGKVVGVDREFDNPLPQFVTPRAEAPDAQLP
jgi:hypothetical protein